MKQQSQQQKRRKPYRTSRQGSSMSLTDMQTSEIQKVKNDNDEHEPVQCLGPECVNAAMLNSKYCSHECGMKLAKKRLIAYMRSRFNDLSQQPSESDKLNTGELEKINAEMEKLKKRLVELEQRNQQLDSIIERAKFANINPNVEVYIFIQVFIFCLFHKIVVIINFFSRLNITERQKQVNGLERDRNILRYLRPIMQ